MDSSAWFLAILLGLCILPDLYSFICHDKMMGRIYKKTVEDTNWNTNRSK